MDNSFLESWVNRPHEILGRVLRPFSFAHCLALEAAGLDIGKLHKAAPEQLIMLCEICSQENPLEFTLRVRLLDRLRVWKMRRAQERLRVLMLLNSYFADYLSMPDFWEKESSGGKGITAPAILARIACLLSYSTLTYTEIMKMPVGMALWLQAAIAEQRGADIQFVTDHDRQLMQELRDEQSTGRT